MSRSLADALQSREREDFAEKLAAYVAARNRFQSLLDGDDYNYFAFQVWQEGVARYTEYQVAALAAAEYEPSRPFRDLKDYTSFADDARALLDGVERELASVQLDQTKRVAFYALGAAEGLVLDRADPGWRKQYFVEKFPWTSSFVGSDDGRVD